MTSRADSQRRAARRGCWFGRSLAATAAYLRVIAPVPLTLVVTRSGPPP